MTFIDFFHDSPILATVLTLVYVTLWAVFLYMLFQMYKKIR